MSSINWDDVKVGDKFLDDNKIFQSNEIIEIIGIHKNRVWYIYTSGHCCGYTGDCSKNDFEAYCWKPMPKYRWVDVTSDCKLVVNSGDNYQIFYGDGKSPLIPVKACNPDFKVCNPDNLTGTQILRKELI